MLGVHHILKAWSC